MACLVEIVLDERGRTYRVTLPGGFVDIPARVVEHGSWPPNVYTDEAKWAWFYRGKKPTSRAYTGDELEQVLRILPKKETGWVPPKQRH